MDRTENIMYNLWSFVKLNLDGDGSSGYELSLQREKSFIDPLLI